MTAQKGFVKVATCQFPITENVRKNSGIIRKQIVQAKKKGAHLAHFPETALTGYPLGRYEFAGFDWDLIQDETRSIMQCAKKHRIWVALGSAHRLSGTRKPHNSVYVINSKGEIPERYDKCFGTGGDLEHFSAGSHLSTFTINGVSFGIIICYDTWFVELYRKYKTKGADCILHSIYSNFKDFSKKTNKTPVFDCSFPITHAKVNRFWISSANYADKYQDTTSSFVDPDGNVTRLPFKRAAVSVNDVNLKANFWDPSAAYRELALKGILTNGTKFRDPRSSNRSIL